MTTHKTNDLPERLETLRNELEAHQVSARQTGDFSRPVAGQLHHLKNDYGMPEVFVLITGVLEHHCSVIPGSFEAMQGGPCDLVLPKSVLGDYVTLAMDLATTLPLFAIGTGFAALDNMSYQCILQSLDQFNGKPVVGKTFHCALPYIGKNDMRIGYHNQIRDIIAKAAQLAPAFQPFSRKNQIVVWTSEHSQKAAAASERNDIRLEFSVSERNLVIQIEYSRAEKKLLFNVFDKNGDYSDGLDGCQIQGVDPMIQGTLKDGYLEIAYPEEAEYCQFSLMAEDGSELAVESLQ